MPRSAARPLPDTADWSRLFCSFCGKDADHVRFLTAGVFGGMICDRCWLIASVIFVKAYLASAFGWARRPATR